MAPSDHLRHLKSRVPPPLPGIGAKCTLDDKCSYLIRGLLQCRQIQLEIQLYHPLQITQKQTVTEKENQQQNKEVCVSLCTIHVEFAVDVCSDCGAKLFTRV